MEFPVIHTNFWDAVIAVPSVMAITEVIKLYFHVPKKFVPSLALLTGILFSLLISHPVNIIAGIFMGWFYGYAAIGNYAALKTSWLAFRDKK